MASEREIEAAARAIQKLWHENPTGPLTPQEMARSALLAASQARETDVSGLVERLREIETRVALEAANLIEAQSAEIAALSGQEWRSIESVPECDWTKDQKPTEALLYSPQFGVRSGQVGRFRDHIFGNVTSLHGNAVSDWGATHWMPLPAPPGERT